MCCNHRNFQSQNLNNLDISKNEFTGTQAERKNTISDMDLILAKNKVIPAKNKGIIEKHMKDNSFRIKTKTKNVAIEYNERIKKLKEISNQSKILILKVFNFFYCNLARLYPQIQIF